MTNYKVILFDLDGTLSDPRLGITRCVQYGLRKMGIDEPDLEKLNDFIGPPLQETFAEQYHFSEDEIKQVIGYYRERFKEVGMFENELYPEVMELLSELQSSSCKLVVATSKPTVFAEEILTYFKIDAFFDMVVGSYLDGTRSAKTEIIEAVMEEFKDFYKSDFVMIGDRKHDIVGAKNVGIDSVGVTYGYGTMEELLQVNPTYIVHSVKELREILEA